MWICDNLRTYTCGSKDFGQYAHNMLTIIGSTIHTKGGRGRCIWPLDAMTMFTYDIEYDIHMSPDNYEEIGYMRDLNLLIISH